MKTLNRRGFLCATASLAAVRTSTGTRLHAQPATAPEPHRIDRIRGLMYGTFLGDALGGPIEFQPREAVQRLPDPPKVWREGERLDAEGRRAAAGRLRWRSYKDLRPQPESYGQWNVNAAPGTITDDSRHKLILLHALHRAETEGRLPLTVRDLAQAYLDWPESPAVKAHPEFRVLAADWLEEWQLSARWVLGQRDPKVALPPGRMWNGVPTCCGQMTLPPVAALYAGEPERAYRAAYHLAYFDNGFGRDMNAALVAGLSTALVTPVDPTSPRSAWEVILKSVRETDPYGHGKIRWSQRQLHRWLDFALKAARDAAGEPARMFAAFEGRFQENSKWEAQVPFAVTFGCLALADYDPLAAWQLSLEWGWDTDSYAQMVGAFIGALHGVQLFPEDARVALTSRLRADSGVDLDAECAFLARLAGAMGTKAPVSED